MYNAIIAIVGPANSGKTTLIKKMLNLNENVKIDVRESTVATKNFSLRFESHVQAATRKIESDTLDTKRIPNAEIFVTCRDTAGQHNTNAIVQSAIRDVQSLLCCFSLSNLYSLLTVGIRTKDYFEKSPPGCNLILVGCKYDAYIVNVKTFSEENANNKRSNWVRASINNFLSRHLNGSNSDPIIMETDIGDVWKDENEVQEDDAGNTESAVYLVSDLLHTIKNSITVIHQTGQSRIDVVSLEIFSPFVNEIYKNDNTSVGVKREIENIRFLFWKMIMDYEVTFAPRMQLMYKNYYESIPVLEGMPESFISYINNGPEHKTKFGDAVYSHYTKTSAYTGFGVRELRERDMLMNIVLTPSSVPLKSTIILGEPASRESSSAKEKKKSIFSCTI